MIFGICIAEQTIVAEHVRYFIQSAADYLTGKFSRSSYVIDVAPKRGDISQPTVITTR